MKEERIITAVAILADGEMLAVEKKTLGDALSSCESWAKEFQEKERPIRAAFVVFVYKGVTKIASVNFRTFKDYDAVWLGDTRCFYHIDE